MSHKQEIQDELRELNSNLLYDKQPPVFTVPDGYFENFASSVLLKLKAGKAGSISNELEEISPFLASIPRKMPYSIPENYFTHLSENLSGLTRETVVPAIISDTKQMPYSVPEGYFSNLAEDILSKIDKKPAGKVVSLRSANWMRYAVAAIFAGIIMLSGILYVNNRSTVDPATEPQEWVANKLKNVSNEELQEFIEIADFKVNGKDIVQKPNKVDVRNMLKDVSDKELEAFLTSIPTDEEILIIN